MPKTKHSDDWSSCVHKVAKKGGPFNPYAVCTSSLDHQCEAEFPCVAMFRKAIKNKESVASTAMPQLTRGGVKKL